MSNSLSLLEVLRAAESYLASRGVENPRLSAEHLLASVLGLKRMELYLQFDRPLGEKERAPLRQLIKRRGAREPLQHLLGSVEFYGRFFASDRRALIPRPETEQLVEFAIASNQQLEAPAILDVGTGSGIIALTVALELGTAQIEATDISPQALTLAEENRKRHNLEQSVRFSQSDLWPTQGSPFHLIIANLPYIPSSQIPSLADEVHHDPLDALDGGPDGLDLIRRLIDTAPSYLTPGGQLLLEFGLGQEEDISKMLTARKFRDISIRADYQNIPRFAAGFHG